MAAILQMLHSNRTGESVVPYSQGKFSPVFLWRAHWQSGFNDSIGRMQCDYKSMGQRKRLDLLAFEASAAKTNVGRFRPCPELVRIIVEHFQDGANLRWHFR